MSAIAGKRRNTGTDASKLISDGLGVEACPSATFDA